MRAAAQLITGDEVIDRLPKVFAALDAGQIDVPKALVFTTLLDHVDDDVATGLVDKLIDQARELTTAQLRAKLRRLVRAVVPEALARRTREGIRQRRVVGGVSDLTRSEEPFLDENTLAGLPKPANPDAALIPCHTDPVGPDLREPHGLFEPAAGPEG